MEKKDKNFKLAAKLTKVQGDCNELASRLRELDVWGSSRNELKLIDTNILAQDLYVGVTTLTEMMRKMEK